MRGFDPNSPSPDSICSDILVRLLGEEYVYFWCVGDNNMIPIVFLCSGSFHSMLNSNCWACYSSIHSMVDSPFYNVYIPQSTAVHEILLLKAIGIVGTDLVKQKANNYTWKTSVTAAQSYIVFVSTGITPRRGCKRAKRNAKYNTPVKYSLLVWRKRKCWKKNFVSQIFYSQCTAGNLREYLAKLLRGILWVTFLNRYQTTLTEYM